MTCTVNKCRTDSMIMNMISRFTELKKIHGLDDERPSTGASGPQKMASGLICTIF